MSAKFFEKKAENVLRVLCLGDVVGRPGRRALRERLPFLRSSFGLDLVIANGENASGGVGLTPGALRELLDAGVNLVTSGNHIWKFREMHACLDKCGNVLRPANYGDKVPGKGFALLPLSCGTTVGVLNLMGRVFMNAVDCPFRTAEAVLERMREQGANIILVDFHAEASSEKRAMAHYLDGRISGIVGTHTHVQTADARISSNGTASLTDLGMCGVEADSVIGMGKQEILKRFVTGLPFPFKPARGEASLNGALLEIDKSTEKALRICLVRDNAATFLPMASRC